VFEYDVDFATELRTGARLSVVMDELSREGAYVKPGALHAVRLENAGKVTTAIFFPREDEEGAWYSAEGRTRARPFLRSPLAFARITSGFNPKRIDPITGQRLGHGAVDFGAPTGTPIRAAGDGVVAWAKWNGGHGLHVKLDHPQVGPYRTAYSHLSKLMVKKGQKVRQGDIIGLVGSTGHSTGPHLHYEFWVNGKRVDPMKHVSPVGRTLAEHEMAAFEQVRDQWLPLLEDPVVAEWNHEGTPRVEPL
jgi:murein DD-endopeptidase MepM/ murein hydrolase activator NlpD